MARLKQTKQERTIWYENQNIMHICFFSEKLLAIEMEKTLMSMNKPVYLGL